MGAGDGVPVVLVAVDLRGMFQARSCLVVLSATDVLQCAHVSGACHQPGGAEPSCGGLCLRGELVDELEIPRGERDPGSGFEEPRPPERAVLRQRGTQGCECPVGVAVGVLEEGSARLRFDPERLGACVGSPGRVVGAARPVDLAELVEAGPRQPAVHADETGTLLLQLGHHPIPLALGAEELQLVDAGDPREHEGARQGCRPPGQRVRPDPHPGQVSEGLTEMDDRAVDVAAPHRVDPAPDDGDHGLVEGREAAQVTRSDGREAGQGEGEAVEVGVVVLGGEQPELKGGCRGAFEVPLEVQVDERPEVVGVAMEPSPRLLGEQAAGGRQPRAEESDVAARAPLLADLERRLGRALELAGSDAAVVDELLDPGRLRNIAEPPVCAREDVEIVCGQVALLGGQLLDDLAPFLRCPGRWAHASG